MTITQPTKFWISFFISAKSLFQSVAYGNVSTETEIGKLSKTLMAKNITSLWISWPSSMFVYDITRVMLER